MNTHRVRAVLDDRHERIVEIGSEPEWMHNGSCRDLFDYYINIFRVTGLSNWGWA